MPGQTFGYDDMFDFAKKGELDKLINQVKELKDVYGQFAETIKSESSTIKSSQDALRGEFDKTSKELRSLNTETDDGKKKATEITNAVNQQAEQYRKLSKVYEEQKKSVSQLEKEIQVLDKSEKGLKKTSEQLAREKIKSQEANKKQNREIRESIRFNNAEEGSLERKRIALSKLKREYAQTAQPTDKLKREINQLTTEIKESEQAVQVFNRSVGDYEGSIQRVLGGLQQGGGSLLQGGGIGGLLGGLGNVAGPLAAVAGAGVALDAFATNVAEINIQLRDTARLTGLVGNELNTVTGTLRGTAKVFQRDYNEVLLAANTLSQEFGIRLPDAIEKVNQGFIAGNDINGEYLDSLREYSTQVKAAGLNADEFNAIINTSVKEGIFSDKGIDAVKEAGLRLRELTPATRAALDQIGLSSREIEQSLKDGSQSIFDVIQQVSKQLSTLPPQSAEVGQAIADIFGGAGEDAGLRFIKILGDVNTELDTSEESLDKYQLKQKELLDSTIALEQANTTFSASFAGIGDSISTFVNNALAGLLEGLSGLANAFKSVEEQQKVFQEGVNALSKEQLAEQIRETANELQEYKKAQEELNDIDFSTIPSHGITKQLDFNDTIDDLAGKLKVLTSRYQELYAPSIDFSETVEEGTEENKKAAAGVSELVSEYKRLLNILQNLSSVSGEGLSAGDALADALFPKKEDVQERTRTIDEQGEDMLRNIQSINDRIQRDTENRTAAEAEAEREKWEKINMYGQEALFALSTIGQGLFESTQIRLDNELVAIQMQYEQRMQLAGENEEAQKAAEQKRIEAERKVNIKRAQQEKRQRLFEIAINTASGILQAVSASPLTFGLPWSAFVAAQGAIQAAVVSAQPLPKFAKGVELLEGPGSETSDSIPALLSRGERVVTARENKDYYPALTAIHNREIPPQLINSFVNEMSGYRLPEKRKKKENNALLNEMISLRRIMQSKKTSFNINLDPVRGTIKSQVGGKKYF